MRLRELLNLKIGSLVNICGTDIVFKIIDFDRHSPKRPVKVTLISNTDQRVVYDYVDGKAVECDFDLVWIFNSKTDLANNCDLTVDQLNRKIGDAFVVNVRYLEEYKQTKFKVGDVVKFKGGNASFRIDYIDYNTNRMTYNVKVLSTDKPIINSDNSFSVGEGQLIWLLNTKEQAETSYGKAEIYQGFYRPTADELELVTEEAPKAAKKLPEFAVGDIVKFKHGNCTLKIEEIDASSETMKYLVEVLETDKRLRSHPFEVSFDTGAKFWLLNSRSMLDWEDPNFYHITADRLVKVENESNEIRLLEIPEISKIRKNSAKASSELFEVVSRKITQASEAGYWSCEVDNLNDRVVESLRNSGYTVNGKTISW